MYRPCHNQFKLRIRLALFCVALTATTVLHAADNNWQKIASGLDYTSISLPDTMHGSIHVFRIDPTQYRLSLASANEYGDKATNVANLALQSHALLAINGGFFDPFHNPLGLRIKDTTTLTPKRPISWWGIFYTQKKQAAITTQNRYTDNSAIDFAVQAGPRLLVNGKIPTLKENYSARSGLGIDKRGNIFIAVTENAAITTTQFAEKLQFLGCYNALNLDGGSSSQLYAHINTFTLSVPSLNNVADAVIVLPRV